MESNPHKDHIFHKDQTFINESELVHPYDTISCSNPDNNYPNEDQNYSVRSRIN